jgi:hypothetical protein
MNADKTIILRNNTYFFVQILKLDWCSGSKCRRTILCTSLTNDLCIAARNGKMYLL